MNSTTQNTSLYLNTQGENGFWEPSDKPGLFIEVPHNLDSFLFIVDIFKGYMDIDGIYQATRPLPWNRKREPEVRIACTNVLRAIATFGIFVTFSQNLCLKKKSLILLS